LAARSSADAFGQKNVRLATAVGVRQDTGNPEPEPKIELVRVLAKVPDTAKRARNVWIEVDSAQSRLVVLVVTADPECQCASTRDHVFQVFDERPPDTSTAMRFDDDQRMNFPNPVCVARNGADPAQDRSRLAYKDTTDSIWSERLQDLLPSGLGILPVLAPVSEGTATKDRGLIDEVFVVRLQVDNRDAIRNHA
jgi:hypothetical protein